MEGLRELAPEELPAVGDNLPPEGLRNGESLTAYIAETHATLFKRAADLVAAEARLPEIVDEETDAKATEYVKLIQACEKALDQARLNEKAPYDLCASEIHSTFRTLQDRLVRATKGSPAAVKERVQEKQTAYKLRVAEAERRKREAAAAEARRIEEDARRKREADERAAREAEDARRRAAEEVERKAREEAAAAERAASQAWRAAAKEKADAEAAEARKRAEDAAAKRREEDAKAEADRRVREDAAREEANRAAEIRAAAESAASVTDAELTRSRGARGGVSSLTTFWDFRDVDRATLDLESLRPHVPMDAFETALRSYMKANKERLDAGHQLNGVTFFKNHRTGGR